VPVNNPGRQLLEQTQPNTVPAPGQTLAPKAKNAGVSNPHEAKFLIRKIEILGVTRLSSEEKRRLISKYENRLLGVSDINVLMEAITRAYVKKGYITTRVYLPEQNIQTRTLKLKVIEGRLESFSTSSIKKSQLATAFPTQPGSIIRLPDLEQGMDQLERATSVQPKSELLPGSKEGTSILAINSANTFPGHLSFGIDNLGNPITGEWRWLAEAGFDNLLRVNDVWQASYQHSDHSNAVAGSAIFPFRWWTLTTSASYAQYEEALAPDLILNNRATIFSERLEQVIFRNTQHRFAFSLGFDWTQTTREVLGEFLAPTRSSSFSAGISDTWQIPNHILSAALTYQEGFPIFGVHADPAGLPQKAPNAEFHLLKLAASYFDTAHKFVTWRSDLVAQYAFEGLLSDQQLYLSDPFALRGWSHITLAADTGLVWRNELILRLDFPQETEPKLSWLTLERVLVPYILNDLGYADSKMQDLHTFLGSVGAGLRITFGRFGLDGFFAVPYGNLASRVSSRTFYLVGHVIAF
jgi:hemolysin activation/secretion protein